MILPFGPVARGVGASVGARVGLVVGCFCLFVRFEFTRTRTTQKVEHQHSVACIH